MASYKTLVLLGPYGIPGSTQDDYCLVAGSGSSTISIAYEDESWSARVIETAGAFETLAVKRGGPPIGTDDLVFRLNGADTALTVTSVGSNGTDDNTSDSVTVAVGDYVSIKGSINAARQWVRTIFNPSADNTQVSLYGIRGNGAFFFIGALLADNSGTNYIAFSGGSPPSYFIITTESSVKIRMKTAGSFRNVYVRIVSSSSTSDVVLRSRVNGANGNISITIPAGTTGVFSDTTNSDALAADDEFNFSCSATVAGYVQMSEIYCEYANTVIAGDHDIFRASAGQPTSMAASSSTTYFSPTGDLSTGGGTVESEVSATIGMASGAKKFRMKVSTNTCSSDQVFVVMKNGVATALTFTVGAGLTGEFIDNVNTITLAATDTFSVQQTGGGSGALSVQYFAMVIPGEAATPEPPPAPAGPSGYVYFIERMDNRIWPTIEDSWCVDAGLRLPMPEPDAILTVSSATGGRNITQYNIINGGSGYASPIGQVTDLSGVGEDASVFFGVTDGVIITATPLSDGVGYINPVVSVLDTTGVGAVIQPIVTNYVTVSTNTSSFTASDVGSIIRVGGGKLEMTSVSTVTTGIANVIMPITRTFANDPNNTPVPAASGQWSMTAPVTTVSGLAHLANYTVVALADGGVVTDLTVDVDGNVTLPVAASSVVVGLPFVAQLQTMYMDLGGGPTVQTRRKDVSQVVLRVDGSRAPEIGLNQPDAAAQPNQAEIEWGTQIPGSSQAITAMTQIQFRMPEVPAGQPVPLWSGDFPISNLFSTWDQRGQIAVQQRDPVPLGVTALVSWLRAGDSTGQ